MADQTKILVRDFVVPALIGIYPHEQDKAQRIRVNVEIWLDLARVNADAIDQTMSYEGIVAEIRALGSTHYNLVETIAEDLAAFAWQDRRAAQVLVRVEKLDVYPEGSVGAEIIRSRS